MDPSKISAFVAVQVRPAPSESTDHENQTNDIRVTVGIRMSNKRERDLFDSHEGPSAYITRLIAGGKCSRAEHRTTPPVHAFLVDMLITALSDLQTVTHPHVQCVCVCVCVCDVESKKHDQN